MKNVIATHIPIEDAQKDQLRTLFNSAGYALLREVIAAHCASHQVGFMNKAMYSNENAKAQAETDRQAAARFMETMDVLDGLEKIEDQWFRINLEQRR